MSEKQVDSHPKFNMDVDIPKETRGSCSFEALYPYSLDIGLDRPIKTEEPHERSMWTHIPAQAKTVVATAKIRQASQRRRSHPAKVVCKICHNDFTTTFALARHMASHTGQRAFPCTKEGCSSRFSTDSGRTRHERSPTLHKSQAAQIDSG